MKVVIRTKSQPPRYWGRDFRWVDSVGKARIYTTLGMLKNSVGQRPPTEAFDVVGVELMEVGEPIDGTGLLKDLAEDKAKKRAEEALRHSKWELERARKNYEQLKARFG